MTDEVLTGFDLSPQIQKECLKPQYKIAITHPSSKITRELSLLRPTERSVALRRFCAYAGGVALRGEGRLQNFEGMRDEKLEDHERSYW